MIPLLRRALPAQAALALVACAPDLHFNGGPCADPVAAVWAVHDGEKVDRDDLSHPARAHNTAWDGRTVRLFGGRDEILGFQLVIESGASGIGALQVSLPRLSRRGGCEEIAYAPPGPDPTEYVGRPIQVFAEHYMHVEEPTNANWIVDPAGPAAPARMTGWKPVQLVPEDAAPGRGGLPIAVGARQNQGIWFDVHLARDLPAGIYDGEIRVEADGVTREIPVELTVLAFTLPTEDAFTTMVYFEEEQVDEYHGRDLEDRYHRFAHRNRVEFTHAYDVATATASLGRFDGSAFTPARGYDGPSRGRGNRVVPRTFYGPGHLFDDPASAAAQADAWMRFLQTSLPGARTLLYMPDEPGPSQYPRITQIAANIHGDPGPGAALPIFVTHGYTAQLGSAVDFWSTPSNQYDAAQAAALRAAGKDMGYYNGRRPNIGALLIDTPATDARVHGWAAEKYGISLYFYWHANHWHHNQSAPPGYDPQQNVWASPVTFHDDDSFANGDGVLVYPGEEKVHPEEDRGIAGPVSTIQLANLRRGAQDALYLTLARRCGLGEMVDGALARVVPAAFGEAGSAVSFPEVGDRYEEERRALAEALVGCPE